MTPSRAQLEWQSRDSLPRLRDSEIFPKFVFALPSVHCLIDCLQSLTHFFHGKPRLWSQWLL